MKFSNFFQKIKDFFYQDDEDEYEYLYDDITAQSPNEINSYTGKIDCSIQNSSSMEKQTTTQCKKDIPEPEIEYVEVSTSGDDNVCQMCAQFEGKIFPKDNAPKLPLCPSCSCAFLYYFKSDLPADAKISNLSDFVLPSEKAALFYKHHQKLYEERDMNKQIRICESDLKNLQDFMKPYTDAGFAPPPELACRDILPDLYMRLGKWGKAENTIKKCIEFGAYDPESGNGALEEYHLFKEVATDTLSYIEQNPGCLQRNMYKAMSYEGEKREKLKYFLRYSEQIRKVKHGNTNELYVNTPEKR